MLCCHSVTKMKTENTFINIAFKSMTCEYSLRPLNKSANQKKISYFSTKTYVVCTQKNRLNETVLLSTQNIC